MSREQILTIVTPYYSQNDGAHTLSHALEVERCSLLFCRETGVSTELASAASLLHDVGCHVSRKSHHEIAHDFVMDLPGTLFPSFEGQRLVALACLEHRASWKGGFSSPLSEVISCADRGAPSFENILERSLKYRAGEANALEGAHTHMRNKYGKGGYVKYSPLYLKLFSAEVEELQRKIAALL